jgi:type IX secretion system substrate protein
MKKVAILLFVLSLVSGKLLGQFVATGGEWGSGSSWVGGVAPSAPADDGATITIPAGVTITITNTTINFNGTVNIYGTLSLLSVGNFFTSAPAVLNMDATSSVNIFTGGQVTSGGGGFWEFLNGISIGLNPAAYWPLIDGNTVSGPATIDETGQGPLPITLIFFNAESLTNKVLLTWATATEENFDYFAIERSADGERFKEITRIQGMGESGERVNYEFTDEFPLAGISYYRLRSVDFDGYTEIFDYKMVEVATVAKDFSVFPNPVTKGRFSLQTNFVTDIDLDLIVYSSMGKIEASFKVSDWLSTYDISDLQPGSYLVKLSTDDGTMVKRILVK